MSPLESPLTNPREIPTYTVGEAAHYLGIPRATLAAWAFGQAYRTHGEKRVFQAVLGVTNPEHRLLSFMNLAEAHVLNGLRRDHEVPLQQIRRALEYLKSLPSGGNEPHPLLDHRFATAGLTLFVEHVGELLNVTSHQGQLELRQVLEAHLRRLDRDASGNVIRFFPFTRRRDLDEPRLIVIDPTLAFGRPVLWGTGIPTSVIASRFKAGESGAELAADYGRMTDEIEEAVRCELAA